LAKEIADGMVEHIREEQGFAVELDHLVLWGTCSRCLASQRQTTQ
jgi:Fe2+ or Zn2+ uptake regulation protein